ncbi:hypothetical protein JMJ99_05080 [Companilactobacillus zhachilii]|uniref:hypothetical protein n=1 Tax=Companilactobacillus zhachilii TaxID=2304606 RepID=UPI0019238B2D|nr:hypothetical protein [Companilactobacillus zhachilii]MBL3530735.1 hypothetical protein [Companilactobacillus zhachilii]
MDLNDSKLEDVTIKSMPESMEELFKNWDSSKYHPDPLMKEWDDLKAQGHELW